MADHNPLHLLDCQSSARKLYKPSGYSMTTPPCRQVCLECEVGKGRGAVGKGGGDITVIGNAGSTRHPVILRLVDNTRLYRHRV
eukprot:1152587-Pyramimonas_sp.AAC.3